MKCLLDTNVCIKYLNGRSANIRQKVTFHGSQEILLCSIVKSELFYGAMKSNNPQKTLAHQYQFVNRFQSIPFDDNSAEVYSQIRSDLERRGTPIGPNDLLIASMAIANDLILVTHNTREFGRIRDLNIEDWEAN